MNTVSGQHRNQELLKILQNERLSALFQPVVDALEQRIVCQEVFIRGVYPFEAPAELFRAASEESLLWEAEEAARKASLRRIASLRNPGEGTFFLNISPLTLCDERMNSEYISSLLMEFDTVGHRIGLELSSPQCGTPKILQGKLAALSKTGIPLSVDDVDPGNDLHMQLLAFLKPEYAKLPRHLIHNMGRFNMGQQGIRTAIEVLGSNGTSLVAKGVEDYDELESLLALGIRLVQGYLAARPESRPPEIHEEFESTALLAASRMLTTNRAASDCPVGDVVEKPMVIEKDCMSCEEMDKLFQRNRDVHHAVISDGGKPVGLLTRTAFYLNTGGRFGYSVFQRETVDATAKTDFMITGDGIRVTEVSSAAMERKMEDVYDPVTVVDWSGTLVGTVTVKRLLERTIEAERAGSSALDPLTSLPGNVSVKRKLIDAIILKSFNYMALNINGFRTFNLAHGFDSGDRLICLLADLLKKHVKTYLKDAYIGQPGHDRFAVVSFRRFPPECLDGLCREFDRRSTSLFYTREEQESGMMEITTKSGATARFPLCTISAAVTSSDNFEENTVSSAQVLDVALTLQKKVARDCAATESSCFAYDSKTRGVHSAPKDASKETVKPFYSRR